MSNYDVVVIGAGPAGHHAAVEAARGGARVAIVDKLRDLGGACVHRGTIPSKTLREAAVQLSRMRRGVDALRVELDENTEVSSLMSKLHHVVDAHVDYMTRQIAACGIARIHGKARLVAPHEVEVTSLQGDREVLRTDVVVLAVGSRPRRPPEIPVDHENVLDSDSVLSMIYLPTTLTVLGSGVIACEWASIFAALGVQVTMIDRSDRPLAFMDRDLTDRFLSSFEATGSRFLPGRSVKSVVWDGASEVLTLLSDGELVRGRKLLCALGRVANLEGLGIAELGIGISDRGHVVVDEHFRTALPNIYAVGDVVGHPALAATAIVQGRSAARHALGRDPEHVVERIPVGIFTIPEMSSVGLTEEAARARHGDVLVGEAQFDEVARGHISQISDGYLKLVADHTGHALLGAHIVGDGSTELIGVAQMAMAADLRVDALVENVFNFPTLAEAYRIAALSIVDQREARLRDAAE